MCCKVVDSYLELANVPPRPLPSRFAYQSPRAADVVLDVRTSTLTMDTQPLMDAAHKHGVTLNTLLTSVLASSVMQLQIQKKGKKRLKPVRIIVPVNLRKLTGSRTLRNFSLYSLPTMEGHHHILSLGEPCRIIGDQLREQLSRESLSGIVSHNVRLQNAWFIRILPWALKSAILRMGSPYGCTIMSFGRKITLNMSRFCPRDELGELFFRNIAAVVAN